MSDVIGIILAGGLARRMGGGDKCLIELGGRPLLAWIVERFEPQVSRLILNANGDLARFDAFGLPIVPDTVPDFAGPLAGVLAAMEWARSQTSHIRWIVSVPGDTPFIPRDLVARLCAAQIVNDADLVEVSSNGRSSPVCGLWRVALADDLRRALIDEGVRKVDAWTARYKLATVAFPTDPVDPFFNINRLDDLARAEALLESHSGRPF